MPVECGLEVLLEGAIRRLGKARIGAVVNATSLDSAFHHLVDLFFEHPEIDLRAIFGPQHGFRGETQDNMIEWSSFQDPVTGLPVFSLYGETRRPTPEMLEGLDLLVFDIQDVGSRYYTFIQTLALVLEGAAEKGLRVLVLDRPNPLNGIDLEGPVLDVAFSSFVGLRPLPIRHAMTVGELARYFNSLNAPCDLEVIPMRGWKRLMFYDETGMAWVLPSPNMPTLDTAIVYPGGCLLEGTNVSEGRGTTRPFEFSGAPWVDAHPFARNLNERQLPGLHFRPVEYIPTFHKWCGIKIGGVQIQVIDRSLFRPFRTGLHLLEAYRNAPDSRFFWTDPPYEYEFERPPIDILCGTDKIRVGLEEGTPIPALEESWQEDLADFKKIREPFLLYE